MARLTWPLAGLLSGLLVLGTMAGCGDDPAVDPGSGGTATGGTGVGGQVVGGSGGSGGSEPACGDGSVDPGEDCDDGNAMSDDGCSSECAVEAGYECNEDGCTPVCGDGAMVGGEACDDGNASAGDGCDASCAVEPGYECVGTPSVCTTVCGDGVVVGESCDDGNTDADDGCSSSCEIEIGFVCDDSSPSVCDAICGDGLVVPTEGCDDGATDDGDGCSATCSVEPGWACDSEPSVCTATCGDGLVTGPEGCDDANLDPADGCSASCQVELGYECNGEPSVCSVFCGDGIIFGGEGCDDGNGNDGDGCSSSCVVEGGFTCFGEPSTCVPDGYGDTCAQPALLSAGSNTVLWSATGLEYVTSTPSCGLSYAPDGADVVMAYTATVTGEVQFSIDKPVSTRWHLLVSDGACGTLSPELLCVSEFAGTELADSFPVVAGTTYYFYIVDSTSGSNPLSNPLQVTITEVAAVCGDGLLVGEACDDGNLNDGDGCSSSCTVETGYNCSGEPSVCDLMVADTCPNSFKLAAGANTVAWNASGQDYITSAPSCGLSYAPDGPDLVMEYKATATGEVQFSIDKPTNTRWHLLVSESPCGTITPEILCLSDFSATTLGGTFSVVTGVTYYFYIVDSTSGVNPLSNPLQVTITENAATCGDGVIVGEECDDGNLNDGDGCSSSCTIESGYGCTGEPSVCVPVIGDNCSSAVTLAAGSNTVSWFAVGQEYITSAPSCSSTAPDGPDLVFEYTATVDGNVQLYIDKPTNTRWHLLASDGPCGTISPELTCASEYALPSLDALVPVTAGTTYYFYLVDSTSGTLPLSNALQIEVVESAATCAPGVAGMVGGGVSNIPTGFPTTTEYYVAVDDDPNGWVYVGGTSVLRRIPKAGGAYEDVHTSAGLTTSNLGYDMLVSGLDLFTTESKTTGTAGHFWRISTDQGVSWNVQDYATFPGVPTDDFRSSVSYGGEIFLATHEGTSGIDTAIHSMPATGSPPLAPALEMSVVGERNCSGLAADDFYYYLSCGTDNRLVRVDRTTGVVTLITTFFDLSTTSTSLHASDVNNDGVADYLYVKGGTKTVNFVCDPGGPSPYFGLLAKFGTTTSTTSYGLGFDAVSNVLYAFDDGPDEIIVIQ